MRKTKKNIIKISTIGMALLLFSACNGGNAPNNPAKIYSDTSYRVRTLQNTSRGHDLFQQKCVACHGLYGKYRNNNAADLQFAKLDSLDIVNTIINGKGAMPMFDHVMPDSDLAQLELYVKTLRK